VKFASSGLDSISAMTQVPDAVMERLLERAGQLRLRDAEIAERMGVPQSNFSNWKRRQLPPAQYVVAARAVHMSVDELLAVGSPLPPLETGAASVAPDVIWQPNSSGKTSMLATMQRFADLAREAVPPPQLRLLSQAVSSLFEDGSSAATVKAIDALTPELDTAIASQAQADRDELAHLRRWHDAIFSMAEHEPLPERSVIARFLEKVQHALAEQAEAAAASSTKKRQATPAGR
jgi:hypothetical protein